MSENNSRLNSRLNRPNRKKKNNTLLNVLIGIVLLLIIVVVVNIVTDKDSANLQEDKTTANEENVDSDGDNSDKSSDKDVASVPAGQQTEEEDASEDDHSETQTNSGDETSETDESGNEVVEQSDSQDVEDVTIDPTWQPIGTTQTGDHVSSYDSKSVDWAEKVQALSYGAGLDPSNMFVKFLGNGGSPGKSIGTVTSKDGTEIYRISLEWVDGQGWKPTKKEKLSTLEDAS